MRQCEIGWGCCWNLAHELTCTDHHKISKSATSAAKWLTWPGLVCVRNIVTSQLHARKLSTDKQVAQLWVVHDSRTWRTRKCFCEIFATNFLTPQLDWDDHAHIETQSRSWSFGFFCFSSSKCVRSLILRAPLQWTLTLLSLLLLCFLNGPFWVDEALKLLVVPQIWSLWVHNVDLLQLSVDDLLLLSGEHLFALLCLSKSFKRFL